MHPVSTFRCLFGNIQATTDATFSQVCLLAEESVVGQSLLLTSKTSKVIQAVVRHPGFDLFFAVIVFLNAIFMGIEVQSSIDGDWLPPQLPQVVNYVPWCPMLPAATKNFALRFLRKLLQKNVATWFGQCHLLMILVIPQ